MTGPPLRTSSTSHPAPRLHALYDAREEAGNVLAVPRAGYPQIQQGSSQTVLLEPEEIGLGSVASDASMVAAEARAHSAFEDRVRIYRHDPADAPELWNVDRWTVVDLREDPSLDSHASAASTAVNANLEEFIEEYLFWVPKPPPPDHHRRDLPDHLKVDVEQLRGS